MMTSIARDWIWMLAFFPLWAVTTLICFTLIAGPKRFAGIRTRKLLDASALVMSVSLATAALVELDCTAYINLPFAQPACYMFDSGRPFGFDLNHAIQGTFPSIK
jgi:hypothetical protein